MTKENERMLVLPVSYSNQILETDLLINMQKNLNFLLCYLHSVLNGRKTYGSIGWNVNYDCDISDLQVSLLQVKQLLRNQQSFH